VRNRTIFLPTFPEKTPVFGKKWPFFGKSKVDDENSMKNSKKHLLFRVQNSENYQDFTKRW